jgi:nucleotide-binding universal stress UspA family protein
MAYRRILVPVDYSENSKPAVLLAADFAHRFDAELEFVHVWDRPSYVTDAVMVRHPGGEQRSLLDMVGENAERDMRDYLASLTLPSGLKSSHRLLSGEPASTLLKELETGHYDLCVVGTHGRTGLAHLLMGSVAEKLVRLSPVPVLTVPLPGRR